MGPNSSTCGYCSEPDKQSDSDSSHTFGVQPTNGKPFPTTVCIIYMDMLDRGWRRSGWYIYKPDMKRTCCPQYTIRLDAVEFKPTRSQRQVAYRWSRFIMEGDKHDAGLMDPSEFHDTSDQQARKTHGKSTPPFDLITSVHSCEYSWINEDTPRPAHRFEVNLEPASFTEEKFELYQRYQRDIHQEQDIKRRSSFKRFLVESPLSASSDPIVYASPQPAHLPTHYGSYHQCYRIDGELMGVGILDILPGCVSSVYFMYDKKWERLSPGKVSALREAALAREMHDAGATKVRYLYMGFYVYSCPKMRYKGDYAPSFLLDPEEHTWFPLKDCTPILSQHRYGCFANPEHSRDDPEEEEEAGKDKGESGS
ncbi:arginine-tRNA-protein transferase [Hysterangium stoloniferum]|nr:arginine-tRNA-protein transferase [Hysterangium stoloniferum]